MMNRFSITASEMYRERQRRRNHLMSASDDLVKPILTTTRSLLAPLIVDLSCKAQFEKDTHNLAVFRANMELKELERRDDR